MCRTLYRLFDEAGSLSRSKYGWNRSFDSFSPIEFSMTGSRPVAKFEGLIDVLQYGISSHHQAFFFLKHLNDQIAPKKIL